MRKIWVWVLMFLLISPIVVGIDWDDVGERWEVNELTDDQLIWVRELVENYLMQLKQGDYYEERLKKSLDYLGCVVMNYDYVVSFENPREGCEIICGPVPECIKDGVLDEKWDLDIMIGKIRKLGGIKQITNNTITAIRNIAEPPSGLLAAIIRGIRWIINKLTGGKLAPPPYNIFAVIERANKDLVNSFFTMLNSRNLADFLIYAINEDCLKSAVLSAYAENYENELENLLQQIIDEMNRRGLIYKNPNVDYNINDPGNVTHSTSSRYPHPDETFANPCSSCQSEINYNSRCWADKKPLALLQNGHSYSMMHLLWEYDPDLRLVPPRGLPIDPEKYPVLIIPSGGFMGLDSSDIFKECIRDYVENGGTLIVFSQQHGYEYKALPMGEEIEAYGWREDQACHTHAAAISTYKQCFCSQEEGMLDIDIDGFFYEWPENAEVLLERNRNGMPAMIFYEYGDGKIFATTLYQGFSFVQGSLTEDSKRLLGDILDYAYYGDVDEYAPGELTIPVEIENNSDATVKKLFWML